MADTAYRFRTSLSGFHKGDVAGYIEKTAANHRAEIREYEKVIADLQQQNEALLQQLELLMESNAELEAQAAKAEAETTDIPEPEAAPQPEESALADINLLELQAYRRAEEAERNANARARKLYQQLDQMREDARLQFEHTDNVVKETLETIRSQTTAMERAYGSLSDTLVGSREKLDAMDVAAEASLETVAE